jgi:hypothetical protein
MSKEALVSLFRALKDNVRVVMLNACYTRPQAEAISARFLISDQMACPSFSAKYFFWEGVRHCGIGSPKARRSGGQIR